MARIVRSIVAGSRPSVSQWRSQHVELVGDVLGREREEVAGVGVLGDEPQRLPLAAAADRGSAGAGG